MNTWGDLAEGEQDLAPDEREVWESLAPEVRAQVLAAWRTMYEMEGDSPSISDGQWSLPACCCASTLN